MTNNPNGIAAGSEEQKRYLVDPASLHVVTDENHALFDMRALDNPLDNLPFLASLVADDEGIRDAVKVAWEPDQRASSWSPLVVGEPWGREPSMTRTR